MRRPLNKHLKAGQMAGFLHSLQSPGSSDPFPACSRQTLGDDQKCSFFTTCIPSFTLL